MPTTSLPKPVVTTTRRRAKDFLCIQKRFDGGQSFRYNLETVLNLLVAEGLDNCGSELLLRAGVEVRSSSASYQAVPEHIEIPAPSPAMPADDPTRAYRVLQAMLSRQQLALVDELLGHVASRLRNTAQITSLNSDAWRNDGGHDGLATKLEAITHALTFVASELDVLMGGGLGRARDLPAFSHPACWTDLVPPSDRSDLTESGEES